MRSTIAFTALMLAAFTAGAQAGTYPVNGRFGVSSSSKKDPIDCGPLRVIAFAGDQRTDTGGGVPAYRNDYVRPDGPNRWSISDIFSTGQIANAHTDYTLRRVDDVRLEITLGSGGTLMLHRCK